MKIKNFKRKLIVRIFFFKFVYIFSEKIEEINDLQ